MNKQEFDNKFVGKKLVVNCPTEELANDFLKLANSFGYNWITSNSYLHHNNWKVHKEETCYDLKDGVYTDVEYYKERNYKIVEYKGEDMNLKDLLQSDDKVVYRDGEERWYFKHIKSFYDDEGVRQLTLHAFNDDLKCVEYYGYNIMEIWRDDNLIWKREEKSANQIEKEAIEKEMKILTERFERLEVG